MSAGLGRAYAVSVEGVDGRIVEVEADISQSLPAFVLLGLPDSSLKEAKERIRSAAKNSGHALPPRKLTVNLLPAGVPKRGPGFDLAIVVAALQAEGCLPPQGPTVFLGELSLEGRLRPVQGILPAVLTAVRAGYARVVCPRADHREAALVPGAEVFSFDTLEQVLSWAGSASAAWTPLSELPPEPAPVEGEREDFAHVLGQPEACEAAVVAAAGGHHLLMVGPPGVGKSMIAQRLPGILPPLSMEDALTVSAVHSSSGLGYRADRLAVPPFEAPHHTSSLAALVGGGPHLRPGAISRAHLGVLFLDEACEFERRSLDGLRQPLESGRVRIERVRGSITLPARFQLVLATNPCPCGMDGSGRSACTCTSIARRRYAARLSGPLLDRIDVRVRLRHLTGFTDSRGTVMTTAQAAARVAAARARALDRLRALGFERNADVPGDVLRGGLRLPGATTRSLDDALARGAVSARGYDRVLRVAWTLADLEDAPGPSAEHLARAALLREPEGVTYA
ncbi:YifB family Mg chelatase-like AAA ATPase [Falsarthrobacter nasiphocae]|uniref:Magnesium chelatase family protein n=1 Tax=Falsarthrobacter nasiphocae TaxID=189863 RepID=A0AAE4C8Y3_9MICC|nr:YifB family Mg chelatase-like AAA ATPase [Falsarthrobacter nasiphocae]MDR6892870.1 magnesium chelatase family protein [Falsarthrobacter nasiphocae]